MTNFDVETIGSKTILLITSGIHKQSWFIQRANGIYSDPVEVLPPEYGSFVVRRLSAIQGKLWLTGRVTRDGAAGYNASWDLTMTSLDGENWTIDRNQFLAVSDLRGKVLLAGAYAYYPGIKTVYRSSSTWLIDPAGDPASLKFVLGPGGGSEQPDLLRWSLNVAQPGTAAQGGTDIANGDEKYKSGVYPTVLKAGTQIIREAGYQGASGAVYQQVGHETLDEIAETLANAARMLRVTSRDSAMAKLRDWSAPYYWELLSQLKHYDDCKKLDKLYLMSTGKWKKRRQKIVFSQAVEEALAFSTIPHETRDFILRAKWKDNVPTIAANRAEFGLLGLATDADNFVAAIFQRGTTNNVLLRKKRSVETLIATSSATTTFGEQFAKDTAEWDLSDVKVGMTVRAGTSEAIITEVQDGSNRVKVDEWDNGTPAANSVITIYDTSTSTYTTLATGSATINSNTNYDVMFVHRGGHFRAYIKQSTATDWTAITWNAPVSSTVYQWNQSDDPCPSGNGKGHVGIYGYIEPYYFYTEGFDAHVKGVPRHIKTQKTLFDSFPASGTVRVDNEKIIYTGKTSANKEKTSLPARGVNLGNYNYSQPPNGDPADVQLPNFYYAAGEAVRVNFTTASYQTDQQDWDDRLVCILDKDGNGLNLAWRIKEFDGLHRWWYSGSDQHPAVDPYWTTSGDSVCFVYTNDGAKQAKPSQAANGDINAVIVPSLTGVTRGADGTTKADHLRGSKAFLDYDDEIQVNGFWVYDFSVDNSIERLIQRMATYTGILGYRFSDAYSNASVALTAGLGVWGAGTWLSGPDQRDFDLTFTMPALADNQELGVMFRADQKNWAAFTGLTLGILKSGGAHYLKLYSGGVDTLLEKFPVMQNPASNALVRVVVSDEFVAVYFDGVLAGSFHNNSFQSQAQNYIGFNVYNANLTVTDVRIPELYEWKDGVNVDIKAAGMGVIGNIVGDRPVQFFGDAEGKLRVSLFTAHDALGSYGAELYVDDSMASSAEVVTHVRIECEDIAEYIDPEANIYGYRMASLSTPGLTIAQAYAEAQRVVKRAKEAANQRSIAAGAQLHWEPEDTLTVSYTASATGQVVSENVVLTDLTYSYSPANLEMKAGARKKL